MSICVDVDAADCRECKQPVNPRTGRCVSHPDSVTVMTGNGSPIHVALVGDPGCAGAGIRATSESFRVVETFTVQDDHTTMLVEDAKKLRQPIITEAVKYARLNKPETDKDQLTTRFERWTCEEIADYRDSQKENYLLRNPTATKQLSYGGEIAEPVKQRWVALGDILKRLNDGGE